MEGESIYRIQGVTRLEMLRLKSTEGLQFEPEPVPPGTYGEPATFVMVVTVTGILALAAYLLKDREKKEEFAEVEEVRPDGTRLVKRVRLKSSSEKAGKEIAAILEQIRGHSSK